MKAIYCPIETSLNFQQANKLLKELKPDVVVIPESYTQPPAIAPHKTDLVIEKQVTATRVQFILTHQLLFQIFSLLISMFVVLFFFSNQGQTSDNI